MDHPLDWRVWNRKSTVPRAFNSQRTKEKGPGEAVDSPRPGYGLELLSTSRISRNICAFNMNIGTYHQQIDRPAAFAEYDKGMRQIIANLAPGVDLYPAVLCRFSELKSVQAEMVPRTLSKAGELMARVVIIGSVFRLPNTRSRPSQFQRARRRVLSRT